MKASQLLSLGGIAVLADSLLGNQGTYTGIYGVQCPAYSPLLALETDSICRPNSNSPLTQQPIHQGCDNSNCPHSHSHSHSHTSHHQHNWTHTSPCITSSTSQRQFCVFSDTTFASGRGTTLITSPERARFLSRTTPSFTNPNLTLTINQDLHRTVPAKYTVTPIPGKGLGVIATTFIARGELIIANTPSIMIDYGAFADLTETEYLSLQAAGIEALPPLHRERVLGLSTHDVADNFTFIQQVEKVINTNAFDIDPADDDLEQDHGFYVVFPEIARMNHDCRPNADYWYDEVRLAQWVHAVRDIYPGEEVTISYIDPVQKRSKRKERLKRTWGFECDCAACTASDAAGAASDDRVGQILELVEELKDEGRESRASPQMAELVVGLYELEGLWGQVYEIYALAAVEWNGVGDGWTATKWARRAVELGIWSVGERDEEVRDMDALASDPTGHWSWMKRSKVRMGGE